MNSLLTGGTAVTDPDRRPARWRHPLKGLTPRVVALVAALMLARSLGTSLDGGILWEQTDGLSMMWSGYRQLLIMAAPMLIGIFATANLGPQRGPMRIVALSAPVIFSTGVGTLLRMFASGHALELATTSTL